MEKNKEIIMKKGTTGQTYITGKLKKADVKKFMKSTPSSINFMADYFGVSWHTMDDFIKKYDDLLDLYNQKLSNRLPRAHDNIMQSIDDGNLKDSRWLIGKIDREYKDKLELDGKIDIKIEIEGVDKKDLDNL